MPGQPYVSKLADGRYFTVELPEGSSELDPATGELILRAPAIHLLDRLRVLHSPLQATASPGRLRLLREALDVRQDELAAQLQVDSGLVAEWETGAKKPTAEQLSALDFLRTRAIRAGQALPKLATAS
jgi:DNA-binding transcriptional regulator YiaG